MSSFTNTLINGGGSSVVTPDLLKDISKPITNTDYFDIVITDLRPDTSYNVQFAWIYADDSRSDYSATRTFSTDPETAPNVPSQPTVTAGPGLINVTWNGNNSTGQTLKNYAKVNIYVGGVLKDYFLSSGTKSIPLPKGTYLVTLRSSSATDTVSNATSPAVSVTVTTDATDAAAALVGLDTKITISANTIVNASKQITDINAGGITVYSSSDGTSGSGNRIVVNAEGIAGFSYNSQTQVSTATFAIKVNPWISPDGTSIPAGSAYFSGYIEASRITGAEISTNSNVDISSPQVFSPRVIIRNDSFLQGTIYLDSGAGDSLGFIRQRASQSGLTSTLEIVSQTHSGNNPGYVSLTSDGYAFIGRRVFMSQISTPSSTPNFWLTSSSTAGEIFKSSINIASDPGTTPSGGNPGDIWLYY